MQKRPRTTHDRTCTKCGLTYPNTIEFFSVRKTVLGTPYLRAQCRPCRGKYFSAWDKTHRAVKREQAKAWRHAHPEEVKAMVHRSEAKRVEKRKVYAARYQEANKEKISARGKAWNRKNKLAVLNHYSPGGIRCACCGEQRIEFMTLDHVNGGGGQHRKEIKKTAGNSFYRWLIANQFPDGFRVLCFNCNAAFGMYGQCPHSPSFISAFTV